MTAVVPDSVTRSGIGEFTLTIVKLPTTMDATNTWASGIQGIVAFWATTTSTPGTQTNAGIAVSESSGTFTFTPDEDNQSATLFVISRS